MLLGCPNAVNARKRGSVLLGRTNYPPISQFWNEGDPSWWGHVREPVLADMVWMAEQVGLRVMGVYGRNFLGKQNFGAWAR